MSNELSDANFGTISTVANRRLYSDLPLAFTIHPNTSDLTALRDIDAVKHSVKNLILTDFTERVFEPHIGSNVASLLFENADVFTSMAIKDEIIRVLKEYEPRVNGVVVDVVDQRDHNSYHVTIQFNVVFSDQRQEINFYLERTR